MYCGTYDRRGIAEKEGTEGLYHVLPTNQALELSSSKWLSLIKFEQLFPKICLHHNPSPEVSLICFRRNSSSGKCRHRVSFVWTSRAGSFQESYQSEVAHFQYGCLKSLKDSSNTTQRNQRKCVRMDLTIIMIMIKYQSIHYKKGSSFDLWLGHEATALKGNWQKGG